MDNMRQYLSALNISSEQKRYAMNFCKKIQYLKELHELASKEVNDYIQVGYGNVNSKICFVFKDKNSCDIIRPLIQSVLDKFNINTWEVYITFVNKTAKDYSRKYSFLVNEIYAVNPELLYVFDTDDIMYNDIINAFLTRNVSLPNKHFLVDTQKISSTDTNIRKELWNIFRYLINYKETKQEE